jgi:hypothetical protein
MAALTSSQAPALFSAGYAARYVVYAIRSVTTNDTLSVLGMFFNVSYTYFASLTQNSASSPTVSGTTLTFAAAGLAGDNGYLVVVGGGDTGGSVV